MFPLQAGNAYDATKDATKNAYEKTKCAASNGAEAVSDKVRDFLDLGFKE